MSHQPVWYRCRRLLLVRAAALKATKARGVELGRHGAEVLAATYEQEARRRAEQLEPVITELQSKGLAKIAGQLNKRKVPTPRGGRWDHSSVRSVIQRLPASQELVDLGIVRIALRQNTAR